MRVIGIAGVGGTGKSELGRALRTSETNCADLEYSDVLMRMANRLRYYIAEGVVDTRTDSSLFVANYIRTFFSEAFWRVTGGEISSNQPSKDRLEGAINGRLFTYVKTLPDQDIRVPISRETKHEHQPFLQWLGGTVTRDAPGLLDHTMYDMVKKPKLMELNLQPSVDYAFLKTSLWFVSLAEKSLKYSAPIIRQILLWAQISSTSLSLMLSFITTARSTNWVG